MHHEVLDSLDEREFKSLFLALLLLIPCQYTIRNYTHNIIFPAMDPEPLLCIVLRWGVRDKSTTRMIAQSFEEQWRSQKHNVRSIILPAIPWQLSGR